LTRKDSRQARNQRRSFRQWQSYTSLHSFLNQRRYQRKVTLVKRQRDSLNSYSTINDLLDELAQLYDDSDKEINFRRKYVNLSQEKSKFSNFYSMFQRLFFYLEYHEKQLIIDLRDKIVYRLRAAWSSQLIQSESLNKIRDYLIHLNNEHWIMNDIKEKKFMIKIRKQVIFAEKWDSLNLYRKIKVIVD